MNVPTRGRHLYKTVSHYYTVEACMDQKQRTDDDRGPVERQCNRRRKLRVRHVTALSNAYT